LTVLALAKRINGERSNRSRASDKASQDQAASGLSNVTDRAGTLAKFHDDGMQRVFAVQGPFLQQGI